MNYCQIKKHDIADGLGVRVSLFVSGCTHHCKGCFQPETWNFCNGNFFDKDAEDKIIESLKPAYIKGLTLLGGDPFEPENQRGLIDFVRRVKKECPDKDIWAYTGYLLDKDLIPGGRLYIEVTEELLSYVDVLVDGPFIEEKKSLSLKFKGSANQRVLDMNAYRKDGLIKELEI